MDEETYRYQHAQELAKKNIQWSPRWSEDVIKHEQAQLQNAKDMQRCLLKYYYQYADNKMIPPLKVPREYADNEYWKLESYIKHQTEATQYIRSHMDKYYEKIREEANRILQFWLSTPFEITKADSGKETVQLKIL